MSFLLLMAKIEKKKRIAEFSDKYYVPEKLQQIALFRTQRKREHCTFKSITYDFSFTETSKIRIKEFLAHKVKLSH